MRVDPAGPMVVTTTAIEADIQADASAWKRMVEDLGLTVPDGWQVRLVEAKYDPVAWTRDSPSQDKATTRAVWRYRFAVEPALASLSIDDLVKRVRKAKPKRPSGNGPSPVAAEQSFLAAMGDTQIGKVDGDGPEGTVDRVLQSIESQKARVKELRRIGRRFDSIYLPWLGDCIEGFVSQGGANAWRTQMPLTEQVRVVRRLMLHQVEEYRTLADRIVVPVVPGNHDVAVKFGKAGLTRFDDSWAVEAAVQVADALEMNPAAYGHVSVVVPGKDELTLTLDIAGTLTGLAHGHQMRPGKAEVWWAEQAHGMQPIGNATLLLTGHLHFFLLRQGGAKTWCQVPAFESESTYWRHMHGQVAPTGAVTMLVGGGTWSDLAVA